MRVDGIKLRDALLAREKTQELLSNIEQRRLAGTLAAEQYEFLKSDYQQKMAAAVSEISNIKGRLKTSLQDLRERLNKLNARLGELRARHDAGEFSLRAYQKSEHKILIEMEELKKEIPPLQMLVDAKSSAQLKASPIGGKLVWPRWALILVSTIAAVVILAGGTFALYKFVLEPAGVIKLPWLMATVDNATEKKPVSDNATTISPASVQVLPPASDPTEKVTVLTDKWSIMLLAARESMGIFRSDNAKYTGVLVSNGGYILTSNHNIKIKRPIVFETAAKKEFQATFISNAREIAILKIISDNLSTSFMKMGDASIMKAGDEVAVIGNDQDGSNSIASEASRILRITENGSFQFEVKFNPSRYIGGAVMNADGELIGIVIGNADLGEGKQGIFAAPIDAANALITQGPPK